MFQKHNIHSFELDMNYKHLQEPDHREVIWGFWSSQSSRGKRNHPSTNSELIRNRFAPQPIRNRFRID